MKKHFKKNESMYTNIKTEKAQEQDRDVPYQQN